MITTTVEIHNSRDPLRCEIIQSSLEKLLAVMVTLLGIGGPRIVWKVERS